MSSHRYNLKIVVAGGGTGGHLYPGIALAEAFKTASPDGRVLFVGTERGLEKTLLPKLGYEVSFVRASRIKGAGLLARIRAVLRLLPGTWDAWRILKKFRPNLVISVGGYAAAPTVLAAWLRRIPSVAVEPNAMPGLTNRVLSRFAKRVLIADQSVTKWFPTRKARVVGVPLRAEVVANLSNTQRAEQEAGGPVRVLVVGGSQGARFLNERMPHTLSGTSARVVHQTGPNDYDAVVERYREAGVAAEVTQYIDDMANAYSSCDVAVTRAGASTVAELAVSGTPALLVPFPYAADDHQAANAQVLVNAGAARMVRQDDWDDNEVRNWLLSLGEDKPGIGRMSKKAFDAAKPQAARDGIQVCMDLLGPSLKRRSLSVEVSK